MSDSCWVYEALERIEIYCAPTTEAGYETWALSDKANTKMVKRACEEGVLRSGDHEEIARCMLSVLQVLLDRAAAQLDLQSVQAHTDEIMERLYGQFAV